MILSANSPMDLDLDVKPRKKRRSFAHRYLSPIVAVMLVLACLIPITWIVMVSFMPPRLMHETLPAFLFMPTFDNYHDALQADGGKLWTYMTNSIIITMISVTVSLILSVLAAYGIARLRPPGHGKLSLVILASRLLPPVALVVPFYIIATNIGVLDTRATLILPYIAMSIPLATWFLQGFFMDLPRELEEQARIDGCNRLMAFVRIILPLAGPGIAAASVFCFTLSWNDMVLSLPLTRQDAVTLPALVSKSRDEFGVNYGRLGAISVFIMTPAIVFSLFVQRWFVRGIAAGSTKG